MTWSNLEICWRSEYNVNVAIKSKNMSSLYLTYWICLHIFNNKCVWWRLLFRVDINCFYTSFFIWPWPVKCDITTHTIQILSFSLVIWKWKDLLQINLSYIQVSGISIIVIHSIIHIIQFGIVGIYVWSW